MIVQSKKKELRNAYDKYLTPYSLIQQVIDKFHLEKDAIILEPCCSTEKTIVSVLETNGFTNITFNIFNPLKPETDFLNFDINNKFDVILTNTPYGDKNIIAFVKKMKQIATKNIICLYPLSILHGTNKYNELWCDKEFGLRYVITIIRPPWLTDFVREDGKYSSGINQYAWFIWEKGYAGKPELDFIDNAKFLINRKLYFS
jgi:hypothetical protein